MKDKVFCHFCGNRLGQKPVENRIRLFCPSCNVPIYENPIPATAAVHIRNKREILLVKRSVEPQKGKWCLPGGFVEMDENTEQCCLRELKEETNLQGQIDRLMGVYLSRNPVYRAVLVIGYRLKNIRGRIHAGDDSDEVRYFELNDLPPIAFESHRALIKDTAASMDIPELKAMVAPETRLFGAYVISSGDHLGIIRKACRAGTRIVQYRDKTSGRREVLENAGLIRKITREHHTLFIVNDYLDIALMAGADGVHLGQDDFPVDAARRITPKNFIIGVSTHSLEQALAAEKAGADYIAIGPVFTTPTKADYSPIGLETVRLVIEQVPSIPVVAIGGLSMSNLMEVLRIGIRNVAMVREFQTNTSQVVREINRRLTTPREP